MAVAVAEHRSANVSNPHSGMSFSFKKKSKWEGRSGWKRPFAPVFSSGCWWNQGNGQGNGWTVVHFWSSVSVGGLNSPSCVCCKCPIIYHKDAHLKVLQLKPISPLEQNHGNRGACGGGWVSFPMWMSAKGAELESRLVLRMAVDGRNVSVISGGQVSPYQTHVCAADQEHSLWFFNHLMLTWNPFADASVLIRWASAMLVPGVHPLVPWISSLSSIPFTRHVCCRSRMLLEVSHPPVPSTLCCSQPSMELTNRDPFTVTPPTKEKGGGLGSHRYSEESPRMGVFPIFLVFLTAACLQLLSWIFKDIPVLSELWRRSKWCICGLLTRDAGAGWKWKQTNLNCC